MLKKGYKQSTTENYNDKKSKRSNRPDIAFKNLSTSQKSLFKQNSLPCVSYIHVLTDIFNRSNNLLHFIKSLFSELNNVFYNIPLSTVLYNFFS